MKTRELAARLGMSVSQFYRQRHRLHQRDKMPRPITEAGRVWDRPTMMAWLSRYHPAMPSIQPANDPVPAPLPGEEQEWRALLDRHYGVPAE